MYITVPLSKQKNPLINISKLSPTEFQKQEKEHLKFSFKYLDLEDKNCNCNKCDKEWFIKLLKRKKDLCTMTWYEIKNGGPSTRCHQIEWEKTNKPHGLGIPSLSQDIDGYQIELSQNTGRLIGFYLDNTFFLRWIDRNHFIYSKK